MARRVGTISLVILTAALLQGAVFARTIFGVSPDLLMVVVISIALLEGPAAGATVGFAGGLLRDLLLVAPKGLSGLAYLITGYAVGAARPYVQSSSVLVPVAAICAGSFVSGMLYEVLQILLGRPPVSMGHEIRSILLTTLYNTLLTPFVYPTVRKIVESYQRDKVYRW